MNYLNWRDVMNNSFGNILTFIVLFFLQIILNDFLNISSYLYLSLIPLAIIIIPKGIQTWKIMAFGFVFGLLFDMISDGVLGLNAAASVALAASRDWLFGVIVNKDKSDKAQTISVRSMSVIRYIWFVLSCVSVYLLIYILLDDIQTRSSTFFFMKFLLSMIINTIITFAISWFTLGKQQ